MSTSPDANELPVHVEEAVREVEERMTAELRKRLGRDDVEVKVDRTGLLEKTEGWPVPANLSSDWWETHE